MDHPPMYGYNPFIGGLAMYWNTLEAYNKRIKTLELLIISISEAPQSLEVKNELILLINKILTYLRARPSDHPNTQLLVDWPF